MPASQPYGLRVIAEAAPAFSNGRCPACGDPVLRALSESGMPVDLSPAESRDGTQAAYRDGAGQWMSRHLKDGDNPSRRERRRMPHSAACRAEAGPALPPNVIPLGPARRRAHAR